MVHALRVVRAEVGPLIAAMSIFVSEPTLEWIRTVPYLIGVQSSQSTSNSWTEFSPEEVILRAQYILKGVHPAEITCRDLQRNKEYHKLFDMSTIGKVLAAVRGTVSADALCIGASTSAKRIHDSRPYRATLPPNELSVEQQVMFKSNHF